MNSVTEIEENMWELFFAPDLMYKNILLRHVILCLFIVPNLCFAGSVGLISYRLFFFVGIALVISIIAAIANDQVN